MRVAVIGTGIAGNAAAWTLSKRYPVTVYDRDLRPGGHSHTVTIDYDGTAARGRYRLHRLQRTELSRPDGAVRPSRHRDHRKLHELCSHGGCRPLRMERRRRQLASRPRMACSRSRDNLLSPSYLWMLRDILDLQHSKASKIMPPARLAGLTLGEYFRRHHFAPRLLTDYLAPMGAAIWSAPGQRDAGLSRRKFRRVLRQPSPAAI